MVDTEYTFESIKDIIEVVSNYKKIKNLLSKNIAIKIGLSTK